MKNYAKILVLLISILLIYCVGVFVCEPPNLMYATVVAIITVLAWTEWFLNDA